MSQTIPDRHELKFIFCSSAAFPNSKHAPPRKGDDDLNKRSNKLNGVQYFLKDSVRQMIEWKFEDFQDRFIQLGELNYEIHQVRRYLVSLKFGLQIRSELDV